MRCQYCGREAQPGQVYCECGHPISLSGGNDYGAASGFHEPPSDYDKNWYTPDGRSLSSLEKKPGMGFGVKVLIMLIIFALICVGVFFAFKLFKSKDVLDEDSWEKRELGSCTITIPSALKESDNIIELNSNYTKLGFFTSENAAVHVTQYQLSDNEKQVLEAQGGVNTIKQNLIATSKKRKINGQQLDPKERGDLICVEYPATKKHYISSTDDVWVLDATLVTQKGVYELEACCPKADKDKYIDSMYKWLESFKAD